MSEPGGPAERPVHSVPLVRGAQPFETRRTPLRAGAASLLVAAVALSGCAHQVVSGASPMPSGEDPRCELAADQPTVLISEWSPSEKANLEQALRRGAVAVERLGCGLRVLSQCAVGGSYSWQSTGPAQASVEIDNERTLYEKLPLSASALQSDLRQMGRLRVATQISGDYRLPPGLGTQVPFEGECQYATHVVTSVSVGASALMAGDGRVIRGAGDPQACAQASQGGPHPSCAAPLQLSLMRIPGRGPEEPPPGMAQVDVVSDNEGQVWDLYTGGDLVCTTPCTQWMDPFRPLRLEARGGDDRVFLPGLGPEVLQARNGVLVATGSHEGKFVNGLVWTTLGGMAMVAGIAFTAVGCSDLPEERGMCNAGLITGGAGTAVTALGLWLLLDSGPRADVFPVYRTQSARGQPPMTVGIGPTGIAGTF